MSRRSRHDRVPAIIRRALVIGTSGKNGRTGSMNSKMICSMIVAAAMVTGVSVASVAHAEGEDGITAAGLEWQAANGNASVPATEWYTRQPGTAGAALSPVRWWDPPGARQPRPRLNLTTTEYGAGAPSPIFSVLCSATIRTRVQRQSATHLSVAGLPLSGCLSSPRPP